MAKKPVRKKLNIVWPVEFRPNAPEIYESIFRMLKILQEKFQLKVQTITLIPDVLEKATQRELVEIAKDSIEIMLDSFDPKIFAEPKVIIAKSISRRVQAKQLAQLADKELADVIICGTHSRGPVAKLFLGSFSENLLMKSKRPVLVVNPAFMAKTQFKHFLFPTDFGRNSQRAFKTFLKWADAYGARVTVLHQLNYPMNPFIDAEQFKSPKSFNDLHSFQAKQKKRIQAQIKKWTGLFSQGRSLQFLIEDQVAPISDSILDYARREKVDLIGLSNEPLNLSTILTGSVTRQIVREAEQPVLVI